MDRRLAEANCPELRGIGYSSLDSLTRVFASLQMPSSIERIFQRKDQRDMEYNIKPKRNWTEEELSRWKSERESGQDAYSDALKKNNLHGSCPDPIRHSKKMD